MSRRVFVLLIAVLAGVFGAFFATAAAGAGTAGGVTYIRGNQKSDGGFAEPGRSTTGADATTSWCVMALCAAGTNPHDVRENGLSPLDFLASQSGNWHSVTDYERTLLAAAAAGEDLHSFGGVDLVARVRSYQRPGGNIGDAVNSNAFGMLAYAAAGLAVPAGAVQWHRDVQNPDGGWGNSPGAASNPDMTGASIMGLRAAGVGAGDPSIQSALDYLHSVQNPDGGFSFQHGASDVAATSWCIQAIAAVGQEAAGPEWSVSGNTPYGFVASMQTAGGYFLWTAGTERNPVWITSYAVCAMAGKPFPIRSSFVSPGRAQGAGEDDGQDASDQPYASPGEAGQEQEEGNEGAEEPGGGEPPQSEKGESQASGEEPADKDGAGLASPGVGTNPDADTGGGSTQGGPPSPLWLLPPLGTALLFYLWGRYEYARYASR